MADLRNRPPTKEARERAEALFQEKSVEAEKEKAIREAQEAEAIARQEKTEKLRALRLEKEAADKKAGIKGATLKSVLLARKRQR